MFKMIYNVCMLIWAKVFNTGPYKVEKSIKVYGSEKDLPPSVQARLAAKRKAASE